jgi:hypothetical protein
MDPLIGEIIGKMAKFPGARVEHDDCSVTYLPDTPTGFVVRLVVMERTRAQERYSVYYAGSHEEFDRSDIAILQFGLGLSTGCQVREFSRGGSTYRWVVDLKNGIVWKPDWEIVRLSIGLWQFWRHPVVRCLQNRLIDLDDGEGPDATAGNAVRKQGGGSPSLPAAQEIPREKKKGRR